MRPAVVTVVGAITIAATAADAVAQVMSPEDVLDLPSIAVDHRSRYGVDSLQFGELRLPSGTGPFPVAIIIHGGCWLSRANRQILEPVATALTQAGFATWNLEYRPTDVPGGGWPGTFQDIARGIDHVRELQREFPLDSSRVIAVGHSSGGHLALWAGGRKRLRVDSSLYSTEPLPLRAVVSLGGVLDLAAFRSRRPFLCGFDVLSELLGGTPEQVPERYAEASPSQLLPLGTHQLLVNGTRDSTMLPEENRAYVEAARLAGDRVEFMEPEGAGHFEVIAPTSAAWAAIEAAILNTVGLRTERPRGRLRHQQEGNGS